MEAGQDISRTYSEIAPPLWRALLVYSGGNRSIADDALAEAFARFIQYGRGVRRAFPWLYRTAFRIAAAELRAASRTPEPAPGDEPWLDPGPERERLEHLLWALRALSPTQRAAVYLHYQADLPVREIAERLGISASAIRVHLHRGRNRLRSLLTEEDGS